jgi:hypothetical protein
MAHLHAWRSMTSHAIPVPSSRCTSSRSGPRVPHSWSPQGVVSTPRRCGGPGNGRAPACDLRLNAQPVRRYRTGHGRTDHEHRSAGAQGLGRSPYPPVMHDQPGMRQQPPVRGVVERRDAFGQGPWRPTIANQQEGTPTQCLGGGEALLKEILGHPDRRRTEGEHDRRGTGVQKPLQRRWQPGGSAGRPHRS